MGEVLIAPLDFAINPVRGGTTTARLATGGLPAKGDLTARRRLPRAGLTCLLRRSIGNFGLLATSSSAGLCTLLTAGALLTAG